MVTETVGRYVSKHTDVAIVPYQVFNPVPKRILWKSSKEDALKNVNTSSTYGLHHYIGTWWKPTKYKQVQDKTPVFTIVTPTVGREFIVSQKCLQRIGSICSFHNVGQ